MQRPRTASKPSILNSERPGSEKANVQEVHVETQLELVRVQLENSHLEPRSTQSHEHENPAPCHFALLPPEIQLIVLCYALPPSWLMSAREESLPPFYHSIWSVDLRMKRSIIGVCRTWYRIALGLLYESVTLRRIGQMPAFVCALEGRHELGVLVQNLNISCFVPHRYSTLHDQEIKRIFELCPNLSHFGFKPPFTIPTALPSIPAVGSTITSLEYSSNIEYCLILPSLVQLSERLRALEITLPATYDTAHPTLIFPKLEDLRLQSRCAVPESKWLMPGLQRLWLHRGRVVDDTYRRREAEAFLDVHGHNIRFLWLSDFSMDADNSIQGLLERCPSLEHLAMGLLAIIDMRACPVSSLKHQTINTIDIFSVASRVHSAYFRAFNGGFPALRTFRILHETLRLLRELPTSLPHETYMFFGDDEPPESGWIPALLSEDYWQDDDDDEDYVFNAQSDDEGSVGDSTDDDASDSDAVSCITVSEDGGYVSVAGEFYLEEDRQITHDEALDIFRRMQTCFSCIYISIKMATPISLSPKRKH